MRNLLNWPSSFSKQKLVLRLRDFWFWEISSPKKSEKGKRSRNLRKLKLVKKGNVRGADAECAATMCSKPVSDILNVVLTRCAIRVAQTYMQYVHVLNRDGDGGFVVEMLRCACVLCNYVVMCMSLGWCTVNVFVIILFIWPQSQGWVCNISCGVT